MYDTWANIRTAGFVSEADVELRLVEPLLHALGYETTDIESKFPVEFQEGRESIKSGRSSGLLAGLTLGRPEAWVPLPKCLLEPIVENLGTRL